MSYGGELSGQRRRSPYVLASLQSPVQPLAVTSPFSVTPQQLERMAKEMVEGGAGREELGATSGIARPPTNGTVSDIDPTVSGTIQC